MLYLKRAIEMLSLLIIVLTLFHCRNASSGESNCGKVHITVSSQYHSQLELNWITDCQGSQVKPEYIILSSKNIAERNEHLEIIDKVKVSDYPNGYYRTKVKFGHPWTPGGWEYDAGVTRPEPGLHCYPYWIASVGSNRTIDTQCLGIRPTWMSDNSAKIGGLRIGSMFIPGTHNSGSFGGVKLFDKHILNQDRDIWTQLVSGIRYLDMRVGYYHNEGFFINHDLIRVMKIGPILEQLKKYLQLAPKEVVILDFHRFPFPTNFTYEIHRKFVGLLHEELGQFILPPQRLQIGQGPTLNEIWSKNRNLIICYADSATVRDNDWLWSPLQQFWADTKKVNELKGYMQGVINNHKPPVPNPMWALMAELTPQPIDIILGKNGLKKLAQEVNGKLTKWFRDDWGPHTNIVATDYYFGNDLINVAIQTNVMQALLKV